MWLIVWKIRSFFIRHHPWKCHENDGLLYSWTKARAQHWKKVCMWDLGSGAHVGQRNKVIGHSHTKAGVSTYTLTHTRAHRKPQKVLWHTGKLNHTTNTPFVSRTHSHTPSLVVSARCVRWAESVQVTRTPCWAFPCREINRIKPHLPAHCPQATDCLCLPACLQTNQSEETNQSQCRRGDSE